MLAAGLTLRFFPQKYRPPCVLIPSAPYSFRGSAPITRLREARTEMIEVTRLNGNIMTINSDLIKIAEASPDTMLTLIHGEKLIVRESCAEVVEKVLAYRARLLAAVADRARSPQDMHRIVAMASLNPETGVPPGSTPGTNGATSGSTLGATSGSAPGTMPGSGLGTNKF